jgi:DNA polymerase-4
MINHQRVIFHIDVNSAYLSWEAAYRLQHGATLDIRTVPSIVGGDPESRHGIVLAKSMPAKKYNIQTGEVLWQAKQKCPNLVIVSPNYGLYVMCHHAMMEVLADFSPNVQVYSIDEAFIDYTGMDDVHGSPIEAAYKLKNRIRDELGFTVNIGISTNKLLAKMAGEFSKPDKVHTCWPEEIEEKMWPLPVNELFMVGRSTAPKLYRLNIMTIGDLAKADDQILAYHLKSYGKIIQDFAWGRETTEVSEAFRPAMKGIGNSTTAPFDIDNFKEASLVILSLTEMVCMRLRQTGLCARLVSVSIRTSELNGRSHQRKLLAATDNTMEIYRIACQLFLESWKGEKEKIRKIGVRVSELSLADYLQMSILQPYNEKQKCLDDALDKIRFRFGANAIQRASFVQSGIQPVMGGMPDEEIPLMSSFL